MADPPLPPEDPDSPRRPGTDEIYIGLLGHRPPLEDAARRRIEEFVDVAASRRAAGFQPQIPAVAELDEIDPIHASVWSTESVPDNVSARRHAPWRVRAWLRLVEIFSPRARLGLLVLLAVILLLLGSSSL